VWAVLVTVVVYSSSAVGWADGASTAVALTCLALLPTAARLSRRLALNGSLVIGWVPVLWWVRWPFPVDHGAAVVAMGTGALVAIVSASTEPHAALRRLLPRVAPADTLIAIGGCLALASMSRWAFPGSARAALVAMLPGADNFAHFNMFTIIRLHGAVTPALGAGPDGSGWGFQEYPQGFHALAATLSELQHSHLTAGPGTLSAYTEAVAAVVVVSVVVMTAAIVSLPALSHRTFLAAPAVVLTWGAFLWEPGQSLLADGFANFWFAAASAACALILALASRRRLAVAEVAAVGGLLIAVAHSWAPLVPMAAPAVLVLLYPFRETFARALRPRLWLTVVIMLVSVLGVAKALVGLFEDVRVSTIVTALGGIHGTNPVPTFLLLLVALAACSGAPSVARRYVGAPGLALFAARARLLIVVPLLGVGLSSVLLVSQLRSIGTSSYYFIKFFMGFELILAAFVPALCAVLVAAIPRTTRFSRLQTLAGAVAVAMASQAFGRIPGEVPPLVEVARSGTASVGRPYDAQLMAGGIISAARVTDQGDSARADYLALGPARAAEAFYPDGWYHGIESGLTARSRDRLDLLRSHVETLNEAVPIARELLQGDREATLLVAPEYAGALRAGLGDPALGDRVRSW
jgi:hypothetical protein